jgi:hypothetical protein
MPNNKYDKKDLVSVPIGNTMVYVFDTNVDAIARPVLGHVPVAITVPAFAFQGGNSPKPRRAKILTADGWNSSFVSENPTTLAAVKIAGWQVGKAPKRRAIIAGTTARAVTVYVLVRGIKYAWNMPSETRTKITDATMTALGINIATAADASTLVWGANLPRPAKAQTFLTGGTQGGDLISTFVGQAQEDSLPANWKLKSPRVMFPGDP